MSNEPDEPSKDHEDNPFKGTPFEQIFGAFGGAAGRGARGCPTSALMGQMQAMMAPYDGPVNWELATDIARRTTAQEPDPSPDRGDQGRVADAVRLADHWLDEATALPSGVTTTAAWSRAEWIEQTTEVWKVLVEPVAEHVVGAMGKAMPEEARAMAGPLIGMLGKAGGAMFGSQVGSALGGLAGEVLTASDIGLPLGPAGKAALLPTTSPAFAEGLDVSDDDVLLYLALREAAHQRLFAHVPWLREHLIAAVEDYGRGVSIDISGIEQAMGQLDPTNLEAMQEALAGRPVRAPADRRAEGRARAARDHARAGRGLGRRGRRPGHRRADARRGQAAGGHPPPPRRGRPGRADLRGPGRASSCGPAGCATPRPCGARCARGRAPRPATPSGRTPTCCPPPPTSTTRWASARTSPTCPRSATRTSTRRSASCSTAPAARTRTTRASPAEDRPQA